MGEDTHVLAAQPPRRLLVKIASLLLAAFLRSRA